MDKARLIRQALSQCGQIVMPGVYDALSAKIAAHAGFEVIFITNKWFSYASMSMISLHM